MKKAPVTRSGLVRPASEKFARTPRSPVPVTESSRLRKDWWDARYAVSLTIPWKAVLLKRMPKHLTMIEVYRRAKLSYGKVYWLSKQPDLRFSILMKLAAAAEMSVRQFSEALEHELLSRQPKKRKAKAGE